jgi:hypothetical protein
MTPQSGGIPPDSRLRVEPPPGTVHPHRATISEPPDYPPHPYPHPVDKSFWGAILPRPRDFWILLLWGTSSLVGWYAMKKAQNVVVYLRADDVRMLEQEVLHTDPKTWVRGLVRHALDTMRERKEKANERV